MKFKPNLNHLAVAVIIVVAIFYYNVVLNSPIVFGDEGNYASHARWTARNMLIPEEYVFVADTYHLPFIAKPVFYLFESFAWILFGEIGIKLLIPIFSILTAIMIYLFLKKFDRPKAGLAAALIFLLTPSLITHGVLGYADTLFCLLSLCSIYFGYVAFENNSKIHVGLAGLFAGLALLAKITAPFIFILFLAYFILFKKFKQWKFLILIFTIALLIISPWYLIRNPILFGDICYPEISSGPGCSAYSDVKTEKLQGLEFAGRAPEEGTETTLLKFGLLNYTRFAFGWTIPILFIFGFAMLLLKKQRFDKFLILWLLCILPLIYFSTWRAEDTARYMLPMVIPVAIISGVFVSNAYNYLKKYNIALGIIFILIFICCTWYYGQEKLNTMIHVKQFVPGVFDACNWMKGNTPKDSTFIATYGQQVAYQCDRKVVYPENGAAIYLTNNDTSYEHIRLNKVDYIYIIESLITLQSYAENYPLAFVQYIDSSSHFKLVYDNRNKYGQAGVRIYQVL